MRPGRNDPCPCGSGRKFKRCCITQDDATPAPPRFAATVVPIRVPRHDAPLTSHERAVAEALRAELDTYPERLIEVMLARLTELDDSPSDVLLERAARFVASDAALDAKLDAMDEGVRLVCRLLSLRELTRGDLVRLLALRGIDDPARAVAAAGQQFPIVWAEAGRPDRDRMRTLRVLGDRITARHPVPCDVRWAPAEDAGRSRASAASLWLALACAPGAVLRARPRVNADGTLHATAVAKIARTLPHAADAIGAWGAAGGLRRAEVAEIVLDRVRTGSPAELARTCLTYGRPAGVARLLDVACAAPRGAVVSLGDALIAVLSAGSFLARDFEMFFYDLQAGTLETPWLHVDRARDALTVPADLHALFAGDALGEGHPRSLVQASYEVLLSPSAPFGAATIVALAAEIVHVDAVARLRLTRESVLAACGAGLSCDELLAALRAVAGERAVPTVVENAIREWSASVAVARVGSHVVFELDPSSPAIDRAAEILAPILSRRAAPHVLLLDRAPDRTMLAALAKIGVIIASGPPAAASPPRAPRHREPLRLELRRADVRARDLRPFLQPDYALHGSKAALTCAQVRSAPVEPPSRASADLVTSALAQLRVKWTWRSDWLAELDRLVATESFVTLLAASPSALAGELRDAASPQEFEFALATFAAAARREARGPRRGRG